MLSRGVVAIVSLALLTAVEARAESPPVATVAHLTDSKEAERLLLARRNADEPHGTQAAIYSVSERGANAADGVAVNDAHDAHDHGRHLLDTRGEPLLVVHGLAGTASEFAAVVARLRGRFEPHELAYDDSNHRTSASGDEMAAAIAALAGTAWRGRDLTIIGHSLGGIVALRALDRLAVDRPEVLRSLGRVRLVAVDCPWHGFVGPADRGFGRLLTAMSRPFIPAGMQDLRARSSLFQGDPDSPDPVERLGLFGPALPDNVSIELVFAERSGVVLDYEHGALAGLPAALVAHFVHEAPVGGDARLVNFWRALIASAQYLAFRDELETLADARKLDEGAVRGALARHFHRYPGDHDTVLAGATGELLDHLSALARPAPSGDAVHAADAGTANGASTAGTASTASTGQTRF